MPQYDYVALAPTDYADVMDRAQVMDHGIRPMWASMPRIAGPAYPVRCQPGDNLMLHAAIYRAPAGSVVVVQAGDLDYAVSGGNVCATAAQNGIAGFVIDGVIRDIGEVRDCGFPVFARGIVPKPGGKNAIGVLNGAVHCGGVAVSPGDIVVADEEGIAVLPHDRAAELYAAASTRAEREAARSLEQWQQQHRKLVDSKLKELGFGD